MEIGVNNGMCAHHFRIRIVTGFASKKKDDHYDYDRLGEGVIN